MIKNSNHSSKSIITITEKEELENDYERLKRKFNFISITENTPMNKKETPIIKDIPENKKVTSTGIPKSSSVSHFSIKTSSRPKFGWSNKTSKHSSNVQSKKKLTPVLESRNQNLEKNQMLKSMKSEDQETKRGEGNLRNLEAIDRNFIIKDSDENDSDTNTIDLNTPNTNLINPLVPLSKESRIPSESNHSIVMHEGNIDSFNKNFIKHHNHSKNIFVSNPIYNLSNRYLNDEHKHHHTVLKGESCRFIERIREDKRKLITFNRNKIGKLSDKAIYTIIAFIFNQYEDLLKTNMHFASKIGLCMNNLYLKCVESFREIYKDNLELQEFFFKQTNFKKGKQSISVLDLVLKSKLLKRELNNCYSISYSFTLGGREEYIHTWKFDLRKKGDLGVWFASEAEEYNNNIIRYCYSQPITQFVEDDMIKIRLNIMSKVGAIDPNSILWHPIVVTKCPDHTMFDYEKSLIRSEVKFDKLRCCELENMIHVWKNEKSLSKTRNLEEFKQFFIKNFKVFEVVYDFSKFYIYKFKMQASKEGRIKKNKFINCDIEILKYDSSVTNETQCLGTLNINHLVDNVQLRVGTKVLFYVTDLYN